MTLKKNIFGVFASIFCSIPAMADSFTLQLLHLADIDSNEQSALSSVDEFVALLVLSRPIQFMVLTPFLSVQVTISFLVQGFMQLSNGKLET